MDELTTRGQDTLVIAPRPAPDHYAGQPVVGASQQGYPRLARLARGVDVIRFNPRHRDAALRDRPPARLGHYAATRAGDRRPVRPATHLLAT